VHAGPLTFRATFGAFDQLGFDRCRGWWTLVLSGAQWRVHPLRCSEKRTHVPQRMMTGVRFCIARLANR
jgi:hypothetical protein